MQKTLIAAALASALAVPAFSVHAEEPASPHTFTGNVGLFSQYVFRGISQTNEDIALQGGFDYSHASGFYIGTWASSSSWLSDSESITGYRSSSLETNTYGGFRGNIRATDFSYDIGLLQYILAAGHPDSSTLTHSKPMPQLVGSFCQRSTLTALVTPSA
jgi:uncharacterized protein (TIGR02001 family)